MGSDDDHRRKSRKHDKHKSNRGSSGRCQDSREHKKSSSRKKDGDGDHHRGSSRTLTEEEERLYAKAKEYLERDKKNGDDNADDKDLSSRKHTKKKDSKHGKRRRGHSSDSSEGSHGHRSSSKKDRKQSKKDNDDHHDKKSSSRHKKKSKHSHEEKEKHKSSKKKSSKQKSFKAKATKIDTTKLVPIGSIIDNPPSTLLDPETNYFSHNSHLRLYLYRTHKIYFEDLSSSESHEAFMEFTKAYNVGKLEEAYYNANGLPQEAVDQCSRTQHKWKFKTSRVEKQSLEFVRAGVKKQTEYDVKQGGGPTAAAPGKSNVCVKIAPRNYNPTEDNSQQHRKTPAEMAAQRQSDKLHRDRIKLANEEMYGAAKGDAGTWERKIEKRREASNKVHGAARDRESEAYGGAELDDDAIYGSAGVGGRRGGRGGQSFEQAVANQRQFRERKETAKATRAAELLQKEEEKQKKMFDMLGLSGMMKPGQKIEIAPRKD